MSNALFLLNNVDRMKHACHGYCFAYIIVSFKSSFKFWPGGSIEGPRDKHADISKFARSNRTRGPATTTQICFLQVHSTRKQDNLVLSHPYPLLACTVWLWTHSASLPKQTRHPELPRRKGKCPSGLFLDHSFLLVA